MQKITFGQLLQYYDPEQVPADRIQIVFPGNNWECADEIETNAKILDYFRQWIVSNIGCEESFRDNKPVLRVSIASIE